MELMAQCVAVSRIKHQGTCVPERAEVLMMDVEAAASYVECRWCSTLACHSAPSWLPPEEVRHHASCMH